MGSSGPDWPVGFSFLGIQFFPVAMNASKNRLMGLTKELRADWEQTRQYWNDAKSLEFEKRFLGELMAGVNQAVTNIDALERVISQVRSDCE